MKAHELWKQGREGRTGAHQGYVDEMLATTPAALYGRLAAKSKRELIEIVFALVYVLKFDNQQRRK